MKLKEIQKTLMELREKLIIAKGKKRRDMEKEEALREKIRKMEQEKYEIIGTHFAMTGGSLF